MAKPKIRTLNKQETKRSPTTGKQLMAREVDKHLRTRSNLGQIYQAKYGEPLHQLSPKAVEYMVGMLEIEMQTGLKNVKVGSRTTVRTFAQWVGVPPYVLRRWLALDVCKPLRDLFDEIEQDRIERARDRMILTAAGDAPESESAKTNRDMPAIARTLALYDKRATTRNQITGNAGGPIEVVFIAADEDEDSE